MEVKIDVDDGKILLNSFKETIKDLSQEPDFLGYTFEKKLEVLKGAVAYAQWLCSSTEIAEMKLLLSTWEEDQMFANVPDLQPWDEEVPGTQLVLVETIQSFRMRYIVEVPIGVDNYGHDKVTWALDTVTSKEAKETSQKDLGETIISHRVVDRNQALKIISEEHPHMTQITDSGKIDLFVTKWKNE